MKTKSLKRKKKKF